MVRIDVDASMERESLRDRIGRKAVNGFGLVAPQFRNQTGYTYSALASPRMN